MNSSEPIVFEYTTITKFHETELQRPCPVRAILYRSPKLNFEIESDEFPNFIFCDLLEKPFDIVLENGTTINVRVNRVGNVSKNFLSGSLELVVGPCQVVNSTLPLRKVCFEVANLNKFFCNQYQSVKDGTFNRLLGKANFETECGWKIVVNEVLNSEAHSTSKAQTADYIVTHEGTINRSDGTEFSVAEAKSLVDGLECYLSLFQGKRCGFFRVTGESKDGKISPLLWGTKFIEPWVPRVALLSGRPPNGTKISTTFSDFWKLLECDNWGKDLYRAIDFYLNSKTFDFESGIVLAQASLELLSSKVNQNVIRGAANSIRNALEELEIPRNIPSWFNNLRLFAERNTCDFPWDAPMVITKIRNDIVHPETRFQVTWQDLIETHRLCLWYIEMILLRKINFQGNYWNRYIVENISPYCAVPWEEAISSEN